MSDKDTKANSSTISAEVAKNAAPVVNATANKIQQKKVKEAPKPTCPMDIIKYLRADKKALGLSKFMKVTFVDRFRGQIHSYSEWKTLIDTELKQQA